MIEQLRKYKENGKDMDTNFLLAHNLYGKATIPPTDKVGWRYEFQLYSFLCRRFVFG